ncbi:MAG: ATP-binding cassette domain-containing protein, partial [Rhizobiales bacterium]|nr:ATP-binding cassette domain-containing protein [Hyphomicrobiales bacterium]
MAGPSARLEVDGLTKRFGPVLANEAISFTVAPGELHCLLGENGAGKSTLSSCLYGLLQPDSGSIRLDGAPMRFRSPADAIAAGIGMVHQHFTLVASFTGFENILVGASVRDRAAAARRIATLSTELGLSLDLGRPVGQLSV